jgi:hypothetical protein
LREADLGGQQKSDWQREMAKSFHRADGTSCD